MRASAFLEDALDRLIGTTRAEIGALITFDPEGGMALRLARGPCKEDLSSLVIHEDVLRQARESEGPILTQARNRVGRLRLVVCARIQCSPQYAAGHPEQALDYTLPIWGAAYLDGAHIPEVMPERTFEALVLMRTLAYLAPPRSGGDGPEGAAFPAWPEWPPGTDPAHARPSFPAPQPFSANPNQSMTRWESPIGA